MISGDDQLRERVRRDLLAGESDRVEFKEQLPEQVRDLAREVAAMGTARGGAIYLGVNNAGDVAGLDESLDSASGRGAFRDRLEGIVAAVKPAIAPEHRPIELDGGRWVWVIDVPDGDEPVYYVEDRPYIRVGTHSRPATPEEVKARFAAQHAVSDLTTVAAALVDPPTTEVLVLHWDGRANAETGPGLVVHNVGRVVARGIEGQRLMPTGAFQRSRALKTLNPGERRGINPGWESASPPPDAPPPGPGHYTARALWVNPDGSDGDTGWVEVEKR
jgi:hypothetical protein